MSARDTTEGFLLPSEPVTDLATYLANGGGEGLARARQIGPQGTIAEVDRAGLRGRGGAGFPTGKKWASIRDAPGTTKYLAVNGAEGEPGTFKDRALLRANPYQLIEGAAIAAVAIGAKEVFIAVKHTFEPEIAGLTRALSEIQEAGLAATTPITLVTGPDEYLFGEEKALLEVIEGNAPLPRQLPPYQHGLFATNVQLGWQSHESEQGSDGQSRQANPTLVNNVETLSNVPHILTKGADWFRGFGTAASPGVCVVTVVGDTVRSGVAEVEMGVTLRDAIETIGGGTHNPIKAVFSGISNPVLTAQDLDTPLTYEDFAAIGNGLGAAGYIVYDDTTCMVEVARLFSRFLWVESCGQCEACKLGTGAITERLVAIQSGHGTDRDITVIGARLRNVTDAARCTLPVEAQNIVSSILVKFPEEFAAHLELAACPLTRDLQMPKLVDIAAGIAQFDPRYGLKQPDWTYADGGKAEA